MIIREQPPLHLTYCLNIHRGETWAENFAAKDFVDALGDEHRELDAPEGELGRAGSAEGVVGVLMGWLYPVTWH